MTAHCRPVDYHRDELTPSPFKDQQDLMSRRVVVYYVEPDRSIHYSLLLVGCLFIYCWLFLFGRVASRLYRLGWCNMSTLRDVASSKRELELSLAVRARYWCSVYTTRLVNNVMLLLLVSFFFSPTPPTVSFDVVVCL